MTEPAQDPRRAVVAWLGSENIVAEIKRALPDHVPVDWFMRLAQTAILMNQDLASADRPSLLRELVAVAQLGLVLDPQMGEAWLIIDGTRKVQRRVGYQGLRKLALQSGKVTALNAQAVRANDPCEINLGDSPSVKHTIDVSIPDRGPVLGCYAIGKERDTNEPVVEWMSWNDIEAHRDRYSQAGKKGPWGDPLAEIEMGRKTVFRRLCKWLPKSPLLAEALAHEDRLDMRTINPDTELEPDPQPRRSALSVIAAANAPQKPEKNEPEEPYIPSFGGSEAHSPAPIPQTEAATASAGAALEAMQGHSKPAPQRPPIPQTAPGRPVPPQDVGYSEPPSNAPTGAQSASKFEPVVIGGERYVNPEDAALALMLLIEKSPAPALLRDEYADMIDALPNKLVHELLAALAERANVLERKRDLAAREREAMPKAREQEPRKRGPRSGREITDDALADIARADDDDKLSEILATAHGFRRLTPEMRDEIRRAVAAKKRPPEPAGGIPQAEPLAVPPGKAATPTPGRAEEDDQETGEVREDDAPPWVTETPAPTSGDYDLTNAVGDIIRRNLTAAEFLDALQGSIDACSNPGTALTWKRRNQTSLERVIMHESKKLSDQALRLQP